MLPSINMMSATADSTAVKSDELQMTTTSVNEVVSTNSEVSLTNNEVVTAHEESYSTDGEIAPTDSTPTLSKKELRRQRVAKRNLHYNILGLSLIHISEPTRRS